MDRSLPRQPQHVSDAIKASFNTWNDVACSAITVAFDPLGTHENSVSFKQEQWEHSRTSFAVTAVSFHPDDGEIAEADIEVNEVHYEFEADDSGPSPETADLQNTLTHEIGHALGFAHSTVASATMFGGSRTGETQKRSLHSDDIDGLCEIYDRSSLRDTCDGAEPVVGDDSKSDAPDEDDSISWGGGSDDSGFGSEAACSVTGTGRSVNLPLGALLLFFAFSLLVRHGASIGAVRATGDSGSAQSEQYRR